jgi:CheY-like chemotaxis protein
MASAVHAPYSVESSGPPHPISAPSETKRILIVDDNSVIRSVLRTLIEIKGRFEVCGEANSGPDGIQQSETLQPDLVLLDLRMPGMNGLEAAPLIKAASPNVSIVLFTLYDKEIKETVYTAAYIDLVLRKSDGLEHLLHSLQNFLDQH